MQPIRDELVKALYTRRINECNPDVRRALCLELCAARVNAKCRGDPVVEDTPESPLAPLEALESRWLPSRTAGIAELQAPQAPQATNKAPQATPSVASGWDQKKVTDDMGTACHPGSQRHSGHCLQLLRRAAIRYADPRASNWTAV